METILNEYQKSEYMNEERIQKIEDYFSKMNIVVVPENRGSWLSTQFKNFKQAFSSSE
jgi:hypothetical protein